MNPLWASLIDNVQTELKLRSWKQADLARVSGIPPKQLSSYLTGVTEPGFEKLEAIARALEIPASALFATKGDAQTGQHGLSPLLRRWLELGSAANEDQLRFLIEAAERLIFGAPQAQSASASKKVK